MAQPFYRVISRGLLYVLITSLFFFACTKESPRKPRVTLEQEEPKEKENIDYIKIEEWFEYLCSPSIGGRYSGSPGIKTSCDYICGVINVGDDSLKVVQFVENDISFNNIIFHIEGKNDSTIVFGAHYDAYGFTNQTILPGADDNMSGVAVLLSLIEKLKVQRGLPEYCIEVCFWDGEEIGRYGSKYYVKELDEYQRKRITYINVDTVGNEQFYQVTLSTNQLCVLDDSFNSLSSELSFPIVEYNPVGFITDCEPFLKNGISFVNICCDKLPPYLHKSTDVASNVSMNQINRIANAIFDNLIVY